MHQILNLSIVAALALTTVQCAGSRRGPDIEPGPADEPAAPEAVTLPEEHRPDVVRGENHWVLTVLVSPEGVELDHAASHGGGVVHHPHPAGRLVFVLYQGETMEWFDTARDPVMTEPRQREGFTVFSDRGTVDVDMPTDVFLPDRDGDGERDDQRLASLRLEVLRVPADRPLPDHLDDASLGELIAGLQPFASFDAETLVDATSAGADS